jgi:hypothetical protein
MSGGITKPREKATYRYEFEDPDLIQRIMDHIEHPIAQARFTQELFRAKRIKIEPPKPKKALNAFVGFRSKLSCPCLLRDLR